MAKKKNPEQEQPVGEEQETETPVEETEQPQEEPAQEQETEEQEAEETGEEEAEESPQEEQPEDQPEGAPAPDAGQSDENAALKRELLETRGQLAAYAAGVAPDMVADAVTLAMAEAAKAGEVTEDAVKKAMDSVLKRHPEWKAAGTVKKTGGFKLGADRDAAAPGKKQNNTTQNLKRWNRFK